MFVHLKIRGFSLSIYILNLHCGERNCQQLMSAATADNGRNNRLNQKRLWVTLWQDFNIEDLQMYLRISLVLLLVFGFVALGSGQGLPVDADAQKGYQI